MSDEAFTINVKGLDQLLKALKAKPPTCRVGILGSSPRSGMGRNEPTNAEVGAAHEFGTSKLPVRSFLRMPISNNLGKEMERAGLLDKDTLAQVIKSGTIIPWMEKVAISAEACVAQAFDQGGPGWPASDMTRKKNKQTLVETQQLRNSVTSEVR